MVAQVEPSKLNQLGRLLSPPEPPAAARPGSHRHARNQAPHPAGRAVGTRFETEPGGGGVGPLATRSVRNGQIKVKLEQPRAPPARPASRRAPTPCRGLSQTFPCIPFLDANLS